MQQLARGRLRLGICRLAVIACGGGTLESRHPHHISLMFANLSGHWRDFCYTRPMSDDQFTKLFNYMTERFDNVDKQFAQVADRFSSLEGLADKILKNQEIDEEERLVMGHQLERLDRWTHELAKKIGYTLSA